MSLIYVLRCGGRRFYVGSCNENRLQERIAEHYAGRGAKFTEVFEPEELMETRPVEGNFSEDMVVHEYMREHGIDMVRGGTYSRLQLPEHQLRTISDVITHGSRRCFSCGAEGHFAQQCPNNNLALRRPVSLSFQSAPQPSSSSFATGCCFRCGRPGHFVQDCFARSIVNNNYESSNSSSEDDGGSCFRCGRHGHWANSCYAKTHVTVRKLK